MRVVVVGAGLAGLTAAEAISRRAAALRLPLTLHVLEASDAAGGQLRTRRDGGHLIEWGANAFRTGAGATADLIARLGLASEVIVAERAARRRYVFAQGRLHALPGDPVSLLRFAALPLRARLRVFAEPLLARRFEGEESVHAFAARHLGEGAATLLLGTLVRGVYGGDARRLSVDAAFPAMRQMEREHRSLVVAGLAAATRRRPERKRTWSFRGGMVTLTDRLATQLGDALHTNTRVKAIERVAGGYRIRSEQGEIAADAVVLAVPPAIAAGWLRPLDAILGDELSSIEATDLTVAAFAYPEAAFARRMDGFGFLVAPGETTPVLGALFESNVFTGRAPAGEVLVRVIAGGGADPGILTRSDEHVIEAAQRALDAALGLRGEPTRSWLWRAPRAIPQYQLGHGERIARIEARLTALPGVQLAGSAYRGVSVGAIVEDGELVAERLFGGSLDVAA